jgi:hypothetical protein
MSTTEQPPAVQKIDYDAVPEGIYLRWTPVLGQPVTIFVPNRMLKNLARVCNGRAAVLVDGPKEGE